MCWTITLSSSAGLFSRACTHVGTAECQMCVWPRTYWLYRVANDINSSAHAKLGVFGSFPIGSHFICHSAVIELNSEPPRNEYCGWPRWMCDRATPILILCALSLRAALHKLKIKLNLNEALDLKNHQLLPNKSQQKN